MHIATSSHLATEFAAALDLNPNAAHALLERVLASSTSRSTADGTISRHRQGRLRRRRSSSRIRGGQTHVD